MSTVTVNMLENVLIPYFRRDHRSMIREEKKRKEKKRKEKKRKEKKRKGKGVWVVSMWVTGAVHSSLGLA